MTIFFGKKTGPKNLEEERKYQGDSVRFYFLILFFFWSNFHGKYFYVYSIFLSGMREDCVTISRLKLAKLPSDFQCSFPIHSNSSLSFLFALGREIGSHEL